MIQAYDFALQSFIFVIAMLAYVVIEIVILYPIILLCNFCNRKEAAVIVAD